MFCKSFDEVLVLCIKRLDFLLLVIIFVFVLQGLNGLVMGNKSSLQLSAGMNFDDDNNDRFSTGVRHRNTISNSETTKPANSEIGASIIEDISGAYISRSAFPNDSTQNDASTLDCCITQQSNSHQIENIPLPSITPQSQELADDGALDAIAPLPHTLTAPDDRAMNDSGYMDLQVDVCNNTIPHVTSGNDSLLSPTPNSLCSDLDTEVKQKESSDVSSLSDQHMHDLAFSDFSSCQGSCEPDIEDEVVQIEIEADQDGGDMTINPELASTETLMGSLLEHYQTDENEDDKSVPCTNSSTILTDSPRDSQSLPDTVTKDSWTDGSDLWRGSNLSSPFSPVSQGRRETDSGNSRPGSVFGSPLLSIRSEHSRSSSITSADVELEASSLIEMEV